MDTVLDALQEGRLFELPENDKTHALQFLAHVIEAFPQIPTGTDIVGNVEEREKATNTALGKGWACPHARVEFEEDLMCVVGWSPGGIDYGAADGRPIQIIVMYLVPSNQRNHYLREISILAKVLRSAVIPDKLPSIHDLNEVRNYLLDLIAASKESGGPDARARMIRLQTKTAGLAAAAASPDLARLTIEPVTVVVGPGMKTLALTQNGALLSWVESAVGLAERLETEGSFGSDTWRLVRRNSSTYSGGRTVYDCLGLIEAQTKQA
ncbi:MAG: PTS sugar transporter subunit IIA [Spirochaetes bacterium]|nr:PTS sugar transporter subunit IIA [Spirochaetota bacterium]